MNKGWIACIPILFLIVCLSSFAEEAKETKWEFAFVPYVWVMGIEGDVTAKGRKAEVDVGFDDIVDELDFASVSHFIAKRGRWEFFIQPNYMRLSPEGEYHGRVVHVDADVESELLLLEFGTFYRLGTWGNAVPVSLDVLGGGRYWHVDNEVDLDIAISLPEAGIDRTLKRNVNSENNLIDPFVGLRLETSVTKKLRIRVRGDVGGFDISDDTSDFSWQAVGLFEYDVSQRIVAGAGYRALDIRYEKGSGNDKNGIDATIHGPVLGVGFRF